MTTLISSRNKTLNAAFTGLCVFGIILAAFGVVLDAFPRTTPGFNLPQLLVIGGGLLLAVVSFALRRDGPRQRRLAALRKHLPAVLLITLVTLVALELALTLANMSTYFPFEIPQRYYTDSPRTICDSAGCHYDYEVMSAACEAGTASGRDCLINRQGFHDTQEFVASTELQDKLRILALGDSFTFGMSAKLGKSYIETIESDLPEAVLWNMGIPGTGTRQALESFAVYGPVMQPQLTLLGFYLNDFRDNMVPLHGYLARSDAQEEKWYRWTDRWGNDILLDQATTWYYREHRIDPPASELERMAGTTRLGTLILRLFDVVGDSLYQGVRTSREFNITRKYLGELRDATTAADSTLLAILIPHRVDLDGNSESYSAAIRILDELAIPYVDPTGFLDESTDYAAKPDVHWNTVGHQKIGALLGSCLQAFLDDETFANCDNVVLP